jgi:signal transduction histidine kinase
MLLFLVTAVALVLVLETALRYSLVHNFRHTLSPHVARYVDYLTADIGTPPDLARARRLAETLPIDILIEGPQVNWSSAPDELPVGQVKKLMAERPAGWGERFFVRSLSDGHRMLFRFQPLAASDPNPRIGLLAVASILLVLSLAYWAIDRLFSPVDAIRTGVRRIGEGELGYRVQVERRDELGELAHSINGMADDIQAMLEAKRQLLLAISHELRSPLTRARVSIELIEEGPARDEVARDLREIGRLITELLETERLNTRHSPLLRTPESLNSLVREVAQGRFPTQAVTLDLEDGLPEIALDATRIRLMIRNLIDNALRHGGKGAVRVSTRSEADRVALRVSDQGEGIPPEHLPQLLEPFYRADPARQRKTGGFGLGLYLCRLIAEAHGGSLAVASRPGEGTEIRVHIPVERAAPAG